MPTITVDREHLFQALEHDYTTEEFDELCFEYGIELDEDTSQGERSAVAGPEDRAQLKIEVPANRYDLLCFEGIALMLNIFKQHQSLPQYRLLVPENRDIVSITVRPETAAIRPLISGAILRNIAFTPERYASFIALQDKLHQNLARQRTLCAIGTHDLDSLQPPFTFEALPPNEIHFVPLNQDRSMSGHQIMQFYENDRHLGRYLHIIKGSPRYPVILDAERRVCSMPPIINGHHSRISLNTRNVFIEVTATDATKVEICINMMVTMFSAYCATPYVIEPVRILSPHNNASRTVPNLSSRAATVSLDFVNACCGLDLSEREVSDSLSRMAYRAKPSPHAPKLVEVDVPVTRADVLQQCDIMEDVAIAFGFNNLPRSFPTNSGTIAAPLLVNRLADLVRLEAAMAGWIEVMPLILCSYDENFEWLNRIDDRNSAIRLANPKTAEYQMVRTTLLPGLLKTIRENKRHAVPIRVFEVSDIGTKAPELERKCRNERHFAAAWYGKTSGFEMVHGLLDRIMLMLKTSIVTSGKEGEACGAEGYWITEGQSATFLAGHSAIIHLRSSGREEIIGEFGILHPSVLEKYELRFPVTALEINLEFFV